MNPEEELGLRDQLRLARARALSDAEGFAAVFLALERFGLVLNGGGTLKELEQPFASFAGSSPLAFAIPAEHPDVHLPFDDLYTQIRRGRNQAVHEGAAARHLTARAVELCLVLEDVLQRNAMRLDSFMVRDPLTAGLWEPLSFVRQKMLTHSFSFLPVQAETGEWRLVSDRALARFLRNCTGRERKRRLSMRLSVAVANGHLHLDEAVVCGPATDAQGVAETIGDRPILVVTSDHEERLLGIVTAFDLL